MALMGSEQSVRVGERAYDVRRVAVLGAGTMGARIAAHVANAGLPVLLLDIVPASGDRNGVAAAAVEGLKKAKPAAFADASFAGHI
jgi:3-hydroxyacyl-CoA dehydrogenase